MFKHILIATDGSELAQKAVDQGFALAKALNAKATVVMVTEPWTALAYGDMPILFPLDKYDAEAANNAGRVLSKAAETAAAQRVNCETRHAPGQFPADGILNAAQQLSCDLIVMASHGRRGLSRMLLGSQTQKVVTYSGVPVLVCR